MIKRIVQNRSRRIADEDTGKVYTLKETATLTGIPYDTIYCYATRYKCKTLKQVWHERNTRAEKGGFGAMRKPTHETKYGYLTLQEIHDIHPDKENISLRCLSCRLNSKGGMDDSLWDKLNPRKGGPRPKSDHVKLEYKSGRIKVEENFDRNKFCRVGSFDNKCKHYDSCCNSRAFNHLHHVRYDPRGGCFAMA